MNIQNVKNNVRGIQYNKVSNNLNKDNNLNEEKYSVQENYTTEVISKNITDGENEKVYNRENEKSNLIIWENIDFVFYKVFKPLIGISKGIKELLKSDFFRESISKLAKKTGNYISAVSLVTNTYIFFREISEARKDGEVTKEELFQLIGKGVGLYYGDILGSIIGKSAGSVLGAAIGSIIPLVGTFTGAAVGGAMGKAIGTTLGSIYGKDLFKKISTKLYHSIEKI